MSTMTMSEVGALAAVTTTATVPVTAQPEGVDGQAVAVAGWPLAQPVTDHAGLADREVDEHTDGVERDEQVRLAVEDDDQRGRHDTQHDDARGERQPVATEARTGAG